MQCNSDLDMCSIMPCHNCSEASCRQLSQLHCSGCICTSCLHHYVQKLSSLTCTIAVFTNIYNSCMHPSCCTTLHCVYLPNSTIGVTPMSSCYTLLPQFLREVSFHESIIWGPIEVSSPPLGRQTTCPQLCPSRLI